MKLFMQLRDAFSRWIDQVAATILTWLGRLAHPRLVKLIEGADGDFAVDAGDLITGASLTGDRLAIADGKLITAAPDELAPAMAGARVELVLRPDRFIFCPLELPSRAVEFLDGIVRAQIDRLTPWSSADAAFGWSEARPSAPDRITVTVAATALQFLAPYLQAIFASNARSVTVFGALAEGETGAVPIKILERQAHATLAISQVRRALVIVFLASGLSAAVTLVADTIVGGRFEERQNELAQRISSIRTAQRAGAVASGSGAAAERMLERRKYELPPSVLVLETLSEILPDHTYLTELRIEGNKVRLSGVTRNAPSLIGLIEQSRRFAQATFFAPTTRSPGEIGERFHIEARTQPVAPGP
jgi:general secretion pathway protein L